MEKIQKLHDTIYAHAVKAIITIHDFCSSHNDCKDCSFCNPFEGCEFKNALPNEWVEFIDPAVVIRHKYAEVWDSYVTSALKIGEIIEDVINIMEKNK